MRGPLLHGSLALVVVLVMLPGPAAADEACPPDGSELAEEGGVCREPPGDAILDEEAVHRSSVRDPVVSIAVGLGVPIALGGVVERDRESLFLLGAEGDGSSNAFGSVVLGYRQGLLATRIALRARVLTMTDGTVVTVDDGVESQRLSLESGGGYLDVAALAGVRWEPQLYGADDGSEGLSLSLAALGGLSVVNLWGRFQPESIPNFRLGGRSFHWTVLRERFDGEVALRWRHHVGGSFPEHLLGMEIGLLASLFVHVPYLSYVSDPISGVEKSWGSLMAFARLTWEMGLEGGRE